MFRKTKFSGPAAIRPDEILFDPETDFLGGGCFGKVYRGNCRSVEVAVKVPMRQKLSKRAYEAFKKEVEIMSKIYHPNVCLFMGACTEPGNIRIVTELMKGDLESLLRGKEEIPLSVRVKYAKDCAMGMAWLHANNPPLIHRDLKTANMLYDEGMKIKVCDFGLSQFAEHHETYDREPKGTPLYMAPEVMLKGAITNKVDIYSFGIILWEILTRKEAFQNHSDYDEFVEAVCTHGERPPIPLSCPPKLKRLMQECWQASPEARPTFAEIVPRIDEVIAECEHIESCTAVDELVKDPEARAFWKQSFLGRQQVDWMEFATAFYSRLKLVLPEDPATKPLPANPTTADLAKATQQQLEDLAKRGSSAKAMAEEELAKREDAASQQANSYSMCGGYSAYGGYGFDAAGPLDVDSETRAMLALKEILGAVAQARDQQVVELEKFGMVASCFSPLDRGFITRMVDVMAEPWFHGFMAQHDVENILKVQAPGVFLVRFSNRRIGSLCISKMSSKRVIKHIVIPYDPQRGWKLDQHCYKTLPELIAKAAAEYRLEKSCPNSKYRWLFDEQQ